MISPATVDRILRAADIVEVVGDFVRLKKRGTNYTGLCPFHGEKTPSFSVSPAKELYKCFGCGKGGGAVNFIMEYEKISYPEALRYLAGKYNIEIEEIKYSNEEAEKISQKESILIFLQAVQKYYADNLLNQEEGQIIGLSYAKERGLTMQTIEKFGLGWSNSGFETLKNWALSNGYTEDVLINSGMSYKTEDGLKILDRFRERLIFPIHNQLGKVIGFGGRILSKNANTAKYINSPDTTVYNKSFVLYGLFQSKKAIKTLDQIILVEGYMDVIGLNQNGIENAVASSGTSLTTEQAQLIKKYTDNVLLMYDGDDAGQKATLRAISILLDNQLDVSIVELPKEHDPDSFAREKTVEEFMEYIKSNSLTFVEYKIKKELGTEVNNPIKKTIAVKDNLELIVKINDNLKRAAFIQQLSVLTKTDEKILIDEIKKIAIKNHREKNISIDQNIAKQTDADIELIQNQIYHVSSIDREQEVISILVTFGDYMIDDKTVTQYILDNIEDIEWLDKNCEFVFNEAKRNLELGNKAFNFTDFVKYSDNQEINQFITKFLFFGYKISEYWEKSIGKPVSETKDNYKEVLILALNKLNIWKLTEVIHSLYKLYEETQDEVEQNLILETIKELTKKKFELSQLSRLDYNYSTIHGLNYRND